jgi:molybdopterin synthase catalytic subunit/molybdopterin converting factor small subunit
MITVTVRYFAAARERAGVAEEQLEVADATTIGQLCALLASLHAPLAPLLRICKMGCNDEFADDDQLLRAGDDIVVLPPSAGGSPRARLLETPIAWGQAEALCVQDGVGGVVTFTGTVRSHNLGKIVTRLEYSAYAPMACKEMELIAHEALQQWPLVDVQILHRVGVLQVGDIAVQIAVAGAHRAEPFAACRWVIDALKARVPIWKKEVTDDGAEWLGSTP